MSLLSVAVRKARFIGSQATTVQWNSYVTLKLQNVKSTTVTVKGSTPSWEQDFLFEINNLDTGLLIEVWNKGLLWDKVVGYHWFHLRDIHHSNVGNYDQEGAGQWLGLEAELVMQNGEVVGTKGQTGHFLLVDARFELPFAEIEGDDQLQHKLEMLNSMLDQEARAGQSRRQQQYYVQSGVSEDSDYTSDINYPIGQHPNSSASQFLSAAHQLATPQRSLNSSRENSYEKDDDYRNTQTSYAPALPTSAHRPRRLPQPQLPQPHGPSSTLPITSALQSDDTQCTNNFPRRSQQYWQEPRDSETDPLYYNSRPQSYKPHSSYYRHDSWNEGYSSYTAPDSYSTQYGEDYDDAQDYSQPSHNYAKRLKNNRRSAHSLERQDTLYHDEDGGDFQHSVQGLDPSQAYPHDPGISQHRDQFPSSAIEGAVYDQYSQNYDYKEVDGSYPVCDSSVPPDGLIDATEHFVEDPSHVYLQTWDPGAQDTVQPFSARVSKPRKELPKIPSEKVTVMAVDTSVVPQTVQTDCALASYADHYALPQDKSMYNDGSYYSDPCTTTVTPSRSHTTSGMDITSKTLEETNQFHPSHLYDSQTHTEADWNYGGYYDEAGNYIAYDANAYYDESGNLVNGTGDQYDYYNQTQQASTDQQSMQVTVDAGHLLHDPQLPSSTISAAHQKATAENFANATYDSQEVQNYEYDYYNYDDAVMTEAGINDPYRDYDNNKTSLNSDNKEKLTQHITGKIQTVGELSQRGSSQIQKLQTQVSVEYNYAYESAENLPAAINDNVSRSAPLTERSNSVLRRASFRRQASTRDYALEGQNPTPVKPHSFDHEDSAYSKQTLETVQTYKNGITVTVQDSVDLGYSVSIDDEQYNQDYGIWAKGYEEMDDKYPQNSGFHQASYDYQPSETTEETRDPNSTGPVHMDSLESNASDGTTRDPEANDSFEAQYWQKQKERIEKIQDAYTYDSYNPGVEKSKPTFFEPIDSPGLSNPIIPEIMSTPPRRTSNEDWASASGSKKNSLEIERDEWMASLDRKGSQISIKSSTNVALSTVNRKDSLLDSHLEEDDEYFVDDETDLDNLAQRPHRHPSVESAGLSSPTRKLAILNDIMEDAILETTDRKSSLEIPGKDKGLNLKNVSFDEDAPQPMIPERVTKGMTPREKWLWAMNRICAQLVHGPLRIYLLPIPMFWHFLQSM